MKVIKNTTLSDILLTDVGVTIPASGQYTINQSEYLLWAEYVNTTPASQIDTLLTSGDIVVNDGTSDLNAVYGSYHLRYPDTALNQRFLNDSIRSNGFSSDTVQEAIEEAKSEPPKRKIYYDLKYKNSMSNSSFFKHSPSDNPCGSWSGWNNAHPLYIPFDCEITKINLGCRQASFDWRSTPGDIYFDWRFFDHLYNGTNIISVLGTTLEGSYSGNSTGHATNKWTITEFEEYGSYENSFDAGTILGVMFYRNQSKSGQIYTIRNPIAQIEFTEI